jgi:hypothetical protein
MVSHASAIVSTPCGASVHLVGVSHTSAYYGKLAHDAISFIKPDVVVLEIDEVGSGLRMHHGCPMRSEADMRPWFMVVGRKPGPQAQKVTASHTSPI